MPLAIIIPTYNEKENIARLIDEICALPVQADILIVDDNSPDGTGALVDAIARTNPRVSCLHRPGKLGLGTAHIAGMRQAMDTKHDILITMDADFSHNPRYIPALLSALDTFDVVIGSRYVRGGEMRGRGPALRVVSWAANSLAHTALGLRTTDCTAGFRAYRRAVLESIDLDHVFSEGYSFLIELLFLCQTHGWQIGELPIVYQDRETGTSKISRKEISRAMYTVARLAWRRLRSPAKRIMAQRGR